MFDYGTALSGIEFKVRRLIDENENLRKQVLQLTENNEQLSDQLKQQQQNINQLKEEINILKIRNTLVQKGDSAEIKLKINQMIRNIDKSLSLLTNIDWTNG